MIKPEEWAREFSALEAELETMSHISREEWEKEFSELRAELDRMTPEDLSLQAEAPGSEGRMRSPKGEEAGK